MMDHLFKTATSFRRSLEARLLNRSQQLSIDLQRIRRKVAFDRLLVRFFLQTDVLWILKGGYGLEVRFTHARATKDIDLTLIRRSLREIESESILTLLQIVADQPIADYFNFIIGTSLKDLDGPPEGGLRFPVKAIVDGREFVKFHVDIGVGDALVDPTDIIEGEDWLGFAGIAPAKLHMISKEQQFAEKLHAYTYPRERKNSRVKDLVDMTLLIQADSMNESVLYKNIEKVFQIRNTHAIPQIFPEPPEEWGQTFKELSEECGIQQTIEEAVILARNYYQRIYTIR